MNQYVKKYIVCLIFSFDLFVLVWLSEILRNVVLTMSTGLNSGIFPLIAFSVEIFFAFVFVIVPSILLIMWIISPVVIKKLLVQFGLNEKLLDKKQKIDNGNSVISHDQVRYSILTVLYKKAEKSPKDAGVKRKELVEILNVPENIVDFNLNYLEQEKLIHPVLLFNPPQLSEIITSAGINIIEHKEENKNRFPFLSATIPIQIQNKIGLINF